MKIERLKNSKRNVVFGLLNKAVLLLFPFIIRTLILRFLSSEYVGLSSLFTSVLSVLNLAELGFGSALVFSMYKPLAEDDMTAIRALLNLYRKIYRIVGFVVLAAGLCVLPFIKYFIFGSVPQNMNVYVLFAIYVLDAAIPYFLFPYSGCVLASLQRTDIESNAVTAVYSLMYLCQIAVLCFFRHYPAHVVYYVYVLFQPLFNSVLCLVKAIVVKKKYPDFYGEGMPDKATMKDVTGRVKALFGHKLGTVVLYSMDNIVVSAFLGLSSLAVFNNYYLVHASVLGILQVGYNAVKAGIGNSIVTDGKQKNYRDFQKMTFLNACLVGWCTACLLCLYNRFMYFWCGGDVSYLYDTKMVVCLCVYFYCNAMRWIVLTYKDAAGVWKEDAAKPYVESLVNLVLNIVLINTPLGVMGVVISSIVAVVFVSGPWETVVLFRSYFKEKPYKHYLWYFLYTLVNVGVAFAAYALCRLLAPGYGIGDFFLRIAVLVIVPPALYLAVYGRKSEWKESWNSLKIRFKRKG